MRINSINSRKNNFIFNLTSKIPIFPVETRFIASQFASLTQFPLRRGQGDVISKSQLSLWHSHFLRHSYTNSNFQSSIINHKSSIFNFHSSISNQKLVLQQINPLSHQSFYSLAFIFCSFLISFYSVSFSIHSLAFSFCSFLLSFYSFPFSIYSFTLVVVR